MVYGITDKPSTLINPIYNNILEWIHHVIGNLVRTCNIKKPMLMKMTHGRNFGCSRILKIG